MQLSSAAVAAGYRLTAHDTLASTNAEALTLARRGERGPLWIVAGRQTAGRGRRGNEWVSPPGNLYATLLLTDPAPPECAPELSFVTALALHDAILDCAPALRQVLALKWPNDILCGGAKLAGILIEGERAADALAVAIGIGVNCQNHPAQTAYPATDLKAAGADVSAEDLFATLSATMLQRLGQWRRGAGFGDIRADWIARGAGMGGEMRVKLPDREIFGRGEGLDERGRLLLRLPDGSAAGDRGRRGVSRDRRRAASIASGGAKQLMAGPELVFAPLGGIGEIGMNLSIYGVGDGRRRQWLIVDCGVSFAAEEHLPGVDLILPDIRFLIEERRNIVGLVLTHAHEDHMGALIDLWPKLNVPLYATPFAAALFEARRLSEPGAPQIPVNVARAERTRGAWAVHDRFHQRRALDPGIERAGDPHLARNGVCIPATGRSMRPR